MADCGVLISSVSLSGLTTEVTFFPETGGTINLGTQVFPFSYVSDYYFGTYNCYVPTYAYSYTVVVPGFTPTPTPTNTETPTETPTNTPTNTETPTETPTNTPTNTETPTETPTPTNTETPTETPTPTNTETPTETPTNTPTNTETPTNTPTPTQTLTATNTRFSFTVYPGETLSDSCEQLISPIIIYGVYNLFDENIIFYNELMGPSTIDMTGFYNYEQVVAQLNQNGDVIIYELCPLPTQTPTVTPTNTPTNTETPTQTPTQTPTPSTTDVSMITTYTLSGCSNLNVFVADLGPGALFPGDVFYIEFTGATATGCYEIINKINETPVDGVLLSTFYVDCTTCIDQITTVYLLSGCTNSILLNADLLTPSLYPNDTFNITFEGTTPSGCYTIVEKVFNTIADDTVLYSDSYSNCESCEASLPTPTPTTTETPTPTVTPS